MSESTANPAFAAFVAAQSEITNPGFDKSVKTDKYKFQYASLATVLDVVRPPLNRNGLFLTQPVTIANGLLTVTTRIVHTTGVVVAESVMSAKDPMQPQQQGSQITYLRRYGVLSLVGVTADEDDDGASAAGIHAQVSDRAPKSAANPPINPMDAFEANCRAHGLTLPQIDAWRATQGKGGVMSLSVQELAQFDAWLFAPQRAATRLIIKGGQ